MEALRHSLAIGVLLSLLSILGCAEPTDRGSAEPELEAIPSIESVQAIQAIVVAGQLPGLRWPRFSDYQRSLVALYEARGWRPLWLEDGVPSAEAGDALLLLREAPAKGLDARDYDADLLDAQARRLGERGSRSPEEMARFDVGLSVALMRHVSDLHIGRINPRTLHFGYDIDPKKLDLATVVAQAVRDGRIRALLRDAEPEFEQHHMLEAQLALYRAIAQDPGLAPVSLVPTIRPGAPLAAAPLLARWLAALGDLPGDAIATSLYEGPLVAAVQRFQARHGLAPDGVIGATTARALAVPAAARVRQIELALERIRWIPALERGRVVFVHIASFELLAFDDVAPDVAPALQMPVVVGREATQTPVFAGAMTSVVFAPYWNVPRSIATREILPKQRRNPGYLDAEQMEVVSGGHVLGAGADAIAELASGRAQLRQRPGAKNALGRVKFLFPNSHNVYLHDTPSRSLFQRSRRAFSHGCIRVADPEALARWVLRDEGWDDARVAQSLKLSHQKVIPLTRAIPVVIYYTTAVAHRDGTVSFYEDIYGHDAALERALAGGYPYLP